MKATLVKFVTFMVVCSVFTAYLAVTIGNIRLFEDSYTLTATFDDITGLLRNDNVKISGVAVGKVTDVEIHEGRARVTFTVRDNVRLPEDSAAAVRWRNLLGQRYVYLYPGQASTVLQDGDAVERTEAVVDLGELFNQLGPIVKAIDPEEVNTFLDSVVGALEGNEGALGQALDDLARLTTVLAQRDEEIGRLVGNLDAVTQAVNARDRQIRVVLDNLLALATTFSANTGVLDEAITELNDFAENFGTLLENNRAHIDNLVTNLATIVEVVRQKLPNLENTVLHLDDAAVRLFNASRYGEWLNQTIICGSLFRTPDGQSVHDSVCIDPVDDGEISVGTDAIVDLLTGAVR